MSFVILEGMSDHYPCLLSYVMSYGKPKQKSLVIEKRKITCSVDDSYNYLSNTITDVLNVYALVKCVKISLDEKFREPWMTVSIKRSSQKCRKLCAKANKSKLESDYKKYKLYRNVLNKIKQREERTHYVDLFNKIGKNSKLLWDVVNGLQKKANNRHSIVEIIHNGNRLTTKTEISDAFNEHFTTAGMKVQDMIGVHNDKSSSILSSIKGIKNTLKFRSVSEMEICTIVDKLELKKSTGPDGISNLLFKKIIPVIKGPVALIFNRSLKLGVFPDLMKLARVVPLFKSGSTMLPDNY